MAELNNEKLSKVVGGVGEENSSFQIGDWVTFKKERLSPQGMPQYFCIEDIIDADSSMPKYVVYSYLKNPFDGTLSEGEKYGEYLADELTYGHNPTYFG